MLARGVSRSRFMLLSRCRGFLSAGDVGNNTDDFDKSPGRHPDLYPQDPAPPLPKVPKPDPDMVPPPNQPDVDPFKRDVNPDLHPPPFNPDQNPVPAHHAMN